MVTLSTHVRVALGGVLLIAVVLAGWGWHVTHQAQTIRIATVTAFVQGKPQRAGLDYVVETQGWLKSELAKRGYKLEWVPAPNAAVGPVINEAFANHAIEFASYGELPALILNGTAAGVRTRLLLPWGPGDAYVLVPASSEIRSINDLKGRKLAIQRGRPWEIPLLHLLDQEGLSYADFQLFNINPDAGAAALTAGAVDGLVTISPYELVDKGIAKVIWSTKGKPLSWHTLGGFWGDRGFIETHPDITQLVVTAYVTAARWASEDAHRQAFIELGMRNGTAATILERQYEDPALNWHDRWSPLFSDAVIAHFDDAARYARAKNIIANDIDIHQLLDPEPEAKAMTTLGLEGYWTASAAQSGAGDAPRK